MMRSWLTIPILLTALALPASADEAPASGAAPDVNELIERLSHDDWRVREAAQNELAELGDEVVPRLQRLMEETRDREARARAEATLRMIAENARFAPTRITLHVKDAAPQEVLAELARQANADIGIWSSFGWRQAPEKISLDLDREPFWLAMRKFGQATGLFPENYGGRRQITLLQRPNAWGNRPWMMHDCFVVIAQACSRSHSIDYDHPENVNHQFYVQFRILVDPKLQVLKATSALNVEEAVDDRGNSLAPPSQSQASFPSPWRSSSIWDMNAQLQYQPDAGTRLERLRASASFLVQSRSDTWEIPDILEAKNLEKTMPIGKYRLKEVKKQGSGYEVAIAVEYPRELATNQSFLTELSSIQRQLRLIDAQGNAFATGGGGGGGGNGKIEYTIHFNRSGEDAKNLGEPAKLIWDIPIEVKELSVPIEFEDLPIP